MSVKEISFMLNGEAVTVHVNPGARLVDVIREQRHLTGTKVGCKEGDCGACTVLLDGNAVNSCIIPIGKVEGCAVTTIEGLETKDGLHPIQQAFIDQGAVQCGYCIPGMVLASKALLDDNPSPTGADIREGLSGNICRCTGYVKIEAAVRQAAERLQETTHEGGAACKKGGV